MTINKELGFDPINSPELNKKFNSTQVSDIYEKYESLLRWWIDPQFAKQLDELFSDISATTSEIMLFKPDILKANNNIIKLWNKKVSLEVMTAANEKNYLVTKVA